MPKVLGSHEHKNSWSYQKNHPQILRFLYNSIRPRNIKGFSIPSIFHSSSRMRIVFLTIFLFGMSECFRSLTPQENKNLQSICGTRSSVNKKFVEQFQDKRNLFGGDPISGDRAPWAVTIDFAGNKCSGTLISSRHILTASHCLMINEVDINWSLRYSQRSCERNFLDLVFTINHQHFTVYNSNVQLLTRDIVKATLINMCTIPDITYDDIMILELGRDVQLSDFVYPACVPKNQNFEDANNWVEIATFGHARWSIDDNNDPPVLRQGSMQITYPIYEGRGFSATDYRKKNVLRQGDSGGSGYAQSPKDNRYFAIGIATTTSFPDFNSGFVSVGYHHSHICFHTGIC